MPLLEIVKSGKDCQGFWREGLPRTAKGRWVAGERKTAVPGATISISAQLLLERAANKGGMREPVTKKESSKFQVTSAFSLCDGVLPL